MNNFNQSECSCQIVFSELGNCWHLFTPENNPIIFRNAADFKRGMWIFGIAVLLCPQIRVITFELMSNHIHVTVAGEEYLIQEFFALFKSLLSKFLREEGRADILKGFECKLRPITNINDARNVIVYSNRNGFLVHPEHSPFSYPYGANSFFFNPAAKELYEASKRKVSNWEIEKMVKTHAFRSIDRAVYAVGDTISPMCFCDITAGEKLFRGASNYFFNLSRNVESQKKIAQDIGEGIFYTDDELYSTIFALSQKQFNLLPSQLPKDAKLKFANLMHFDYNASNKQISRILKVDLTVLNTMFPNR